MKQTILAILLAVGLGCSPKQPEWTPSDEIDWSAVEESDWILSVDELEVGVFGDAPHHLLKIGPNVYGRLWFVNSAGLWEMTDVDVLIPEHWYVGPNKCE